MFLEGEKAQCMSEEGELWDGIDHAIVFQVGIKIQAPWNQAHPPNATNI